MSSMEGSLPTWMLGLALAAETMTLAPPYPDEALEMHLDPVVCSASVVVVEGTCRQKVVTVLEILFEPADTIVNIGAMPEGIGAVYELAEQRGFATTGIVSTVARQYAAELSPCVDRVFFVEDDTWGGLIDGDEKLSPTSTAMVEVSDLLVGIGGGEVARDELLIARQSGIEIRFFPADMNHQIALENAARRGQPVPTDFCGAAAKSFQR